MIRRSMNSPSMSSNCQVINLLEWPSSINLVVPSPHTFPLEQSCIQSYQKPRTRWLLCCLAENKCTQDSESGLCKYRDGFQVYSWMAVTLGTCAVYTVKFYRPNKVQVCIKVEVF